MIPLTRDKTKSKIILRYCLCDTWSRLSKTPDKSLGTFQFNQPRSSVAASSDNFATNVVYVTNAQNRQNASRRFDRRPSLSTSGSCYSPKKQVTFWFQSPQCHNLGYAESRKLLFGPCKVCIQLKMAISIVFLTKYVYLSLRHYASYQEFFTIYTDRSKNYRSIKWK